MQSKKSNIDLVIFIIMLDDGQRLWFKSKSDLDDWIRLDTKLMKNTNYEREYFVYTLSSIKTLRKKTVITDEVENDSKEG